MRRSILLFTGLAALAGLLDSCSKAAKGPETPFLGNISGLVKDAIKGTPVADAVVQAGTVEAATSSEGRFRIGLVPGNYRLRVRKEGFKEYVSPADLAVQAGGATVCDVALAPLRDDPPATSIQQSPPPLGRDRQAAFAWTGADDATPAGKILFSSILEGRDKDWAPFAAGTSRTWGNLPDGKYVFKVRAKDESGNVEAKPAEFSFEVDATPPQNPSILIAGGAKFTGSRAVELAFAADGAADFAVWEGTEPAPLPWSPFRERKQVVLSPAEGEKLLFARFRDAAGNATDAVSCSILLDLEPPSRPGNLKAEPFEDSEVRLLWDPAIDTGSGVELYSVLRDGMEIAKSRFPGFADRQVQLGGRYTYAVVAVDRLARSSEPSAPAPAALLGRPPLPPANPDPPSEASGQPVHVTLTWQGGDPDRGDTVAYDLFFGQGVSPPLRASGLTSPSFAAMNLKPGAAYSWKIKAKDRQGLVAEGPVWTFSTSDESNTAPSALLSATPSLGSATTVFRFDASASKDKEDPESALRFRWDFDGDGKPDTEWAADRTADRSFPALGPHTVWVFVQDSEGASAKASARVDVVNSPPQADGDPLPQNGSTQEPPDVVLTWHFTDPDPGDSIVYDVFLGPSEQALRALVRRHPESSFRPPEPLESGTLYYWRIEARDTRGAVAKGPLWSFATRKKGVKAAFHAEIAVNPRAGKTTTPFRFDASGSRDPEDPPEALRVRWDWNGDGQADGDWSPEKQAVKTFTAVGKVTVTLEVQNTRGEIAKASAVVTVENTPPQFVGVPSPKNGATDQDPSVSLAWAANDPDPEDAVVFDLFFGPAGTDLPLAAKGLRKSASTPPAPLRPGVYNWKVAARDQHGGTVETPIWTFTVREERHRPPVKPARVDTPPKAEAGRSAALSTSSRDLEGGSLRIRFDWGDGTLSPWVPVQPDGTVEQEHVWAKPGKYVVRAQAVDTREAMSSWSDPRTLDVGFPAAPGEGGDDLFHWDPEETKNFPDRWTIKLGYWFANLTGGGMWEGVGDPQSDLSFRSDLGIKDRSSAPLFRMEIGRFISGGLEYFQADYSGSTTLGAPTRFNGDLLAAGTDLDSFSRVRFGKLFATFNPYLGAYFGGGVTLGVSYFWDRTKLQPLGLGSEIGTVELPLPFLGLRLYGTATKFFRVNVEFSYIQGGLQELNLRASRVIDASGDVTFTPWHFLGLSLGYRFTSVFLRLDEGAGKNDTELDLRLDGFTLSLWAHF